MKKHRIAILGLGVVGGGVAKLLMDNKAEITGYLGCEIEIARILDLRDFPDSPFAALVTHDYTISKNIITILGTIVAMVIIIFVAVLFSTLIMKMVTFVISIVKEIGNRM